jgi:hypothetical protein
MQPPEEEKQEPEVEVIPPLKYFLSFSPKEISRQEQKFQKTAFELERILDENKKILYYYSYNYFVANFGSCLLFLLFPIVTSNEGIETIAQIFNQAAEVPDSVGYGIGGPLSVIEAAMFMMLFSVRKEAIKSSLAYALQKPWQQRIVDLEEFVTREPVKALQEATKHFGHEGMLLICNLTGAMSELIYIPLNYTKPFGIIFTLVTLFYGNEYFKKYTNADYYAGLDFFFKEQHHGIEDLFHDRDFTTILQISLQSLSSVGLRTFPLYYFIAVSAQELLGIWPEPYLVAALTLVQGFFMLYPATFNHYMKDYEFLKEHLIQHPESVAQYADFRKEFLTEKGYLHLLKQEPMTAMLIATRTLLGGYFGFSMATDFISIIINKSLAQAIFLPAGALSFGIILYDAELKRFLRKKFVEKIQAPAHDEEAATPAIVIEPTPRSWSTAFGIFLNVAGNFVGAMSTVGTLQPLIGGDLPEVTTVITLLAIERMLNNIYFNQDKVEDSVKDLSNYVGSFFKRSTKLANEAQSPTQQSCFCWRR